MRSGNNRLLVCGRCSPAGNEASIGGLRTKRGFVRRRCDVRTAPVLRYAGALFDDNGLVMT